MINARDRDLQSSISLSPCIPLQGKTAPRDVFMYKSAQAMECVLNEASFTHLFTSDKGVCCFFLV